MTPLKNNHITPPFWFGLIGVVLLNIVPIIGLFFFQWTAFEVVFFFWLESLAIGVGCLLKMLFSPHAVSIVQRLFAMVFFCIHYGMFNFGHGMFVFMLMDDMAENHSQALMNGSSGSLLTLYEKVAQLVVDNQWEWIVAQVFVLQLCLVMRDFWMRQVDMPNKELFKPYGRVVVMHVAIIGGAFLSTMVGNGGVALMLVLVLLKLSWDIYLLIRVRSRRQSNMPSTQSTG